MVREGWKGRAESENFGGKKNGFQKDKLTTEDERGKKSQR